MAHNVPPPVPAHALIVIKILARAVHVKMDTTDSHVPNSAVAIVFILQENVIETLGYVSVDVLTVGMAKPVTTSVRRHVMAGNVT